MVLMHDAPLAGDLAETHGQSKFKRFPLAGRVNVNALSFRRSESNILAASDLHIVKVKGDRFFLRLKNGWTSPLNIASTRWTPLPIICRVRGQAHRWGQ
jgi:hypothetical protein